MTDCRYDAETDAYLTPDGETCDTPRREHCTARRSCSVHLAWGELVCARCIGRVRRNIRRIADVAPLLPWVAVENGRVDSEAAMLAGPACDVEAWSWRKAAGKNWRDYGEGAWHVSLVEDDDEWHPYSVLTRWEFMLREDYADPRTTATSVTAAAAYLERVLSRVANDEAQDFRLLAHEVRRCRDHLDVALRVREYREKGAPCPDCKREGKVSPMVREYGHWCNDDACERLHYDTDEADRWVCPRNREHWRSLGDYDKWVEERKGA